MEIKQIEQLKKILDLELTDWCNTQTGDPVVVTVYLGEDKVFQVDKINDRFRVIDDGGKYGDWKKES